MGKVVMSVALATVVFITTGCNQLSLGKSTNSFAKEVVDDTKESAENSAKNKINEATQKAFKI